MPASPQHDNASASRCVRSTAQDARNLPEVGRSAAQGGPQHPLNSGGPPDIATTRILDQSRADAKAVTRNAEVGHVIKNQDGQISSKNSYGNDPGTSRAESRRGLGFSC
jgi:hypothetical protein